MTALGACACGGSSSRTVPPVPTAVPTSCDAPSASASASISLGAQQIVADIGLRISLPPGYEIASSPTPLLAPGARAYNVKTPSGENRPRRIALWVFSPTPAGTQTSALDNAVREEDASVFHYADIQTPLIQSVVGGKKAWQRRFDAVGAPKSCISGSAVRQVLYVELDDGSILRIVVDGVTDGVTTSHSLGMEIATYDAIRDSIAFD